jgi:hypothetical protein
MVAAPVCCRSAGALEEATGAIKGERNTPAGHNQGAGEQMGPSFGKEEARAKLSLAGHSCQMSSS